MHGSYNDSKLGLSYCKRLDVFRGSSKFCGRITRNYVKQIGLVHLVTCYSTAECLVEWHVLTNSIVVFFLVDIAETLLCQEMYLDRADGPEARKQLHTHECLKP